MLQTQKNPSSRFLFPTCFTIHTFYRLLEHHTYSSLFLSLSPLATFAREHRLAKPDLPLDRLNPTATAFPDHSATETPTPDTCDSPACQACQACKDSCYDQVLLSPTFDYDVCVFNNGCANDGNCIHAGGGGNPISPPVGSGPTCVECVKYCQKRALGNDELTKEDKYQGCVISLGCDQC